MRFRRQVPRTTAVARAPIAGKTPRDGDGHAATTHRRREGTRVRTLTAAVDNDGGDVSRSTAHSAMARARRRRDGDATEHRGRPHEGDGRRRRASGARSRER